MGASGSHTLEMFMTEVLRDSKDPQNGKSLLEIARTPRRERSEVSTEAGPPGFHLAPLGARFPTTSRSSITWA